MKKIFVFIMFCINLTTVYSQSSDEIIKELENIFLNYVLNGNKNKSVKITFSGSNVSIHTVNERDGGSGWSFKGEQFIKFDILKAWYDNRFYGGGGRRSLVINCRTGIEVESVLTTYAPYGPPGEQRSKNMPTIYGIEVNGEAVINRMINAFKNLEAIAKEKNIKSVPHMFDDAELLVQKISFVAPDETGKLNANQTGCIKVEVKNTNSNNALEISCIVNENNKSDLFTYDQYSVLNKIAGYETGVINIPIKASENIDNNTYQFDVKVSYKGYTLKQETISITAANPKKQQVTSSGTGGTSRNKTVRMRKMSGNTYLVSCKVNGLPLDFIFDTGASSVTLSRKQASFMLRNGYLSREDIVGTSSYQTASGDIATGMVIKLKKIEISGLILNNVEATIINSDSAPLLLGQSALSRLGKIQMDYKNSTLTIIR